ncbi:serine/threonine protein kinase, partial [Metarhizium brunneum ARSEF 3297]
MDDIEALRRKLREAENRALEEQRRREEAENRALQDQHRRQVAEALTAASQPQNLQQYLETCHSLHLAIEVVTNRSLTTQGETTHPTGRIFPRRIIPWDDFAMRQEEIWNDLSISELFCEPAYPSNHQMEYVRSLLKPFSSEVGLRDFERDVVENAVQNARICPEAGASSQVPSQSEGNGQSGGSFCIYRTSECRNVPALAIEYKAPHKLSLDEIITGLEAEVQPERDVINKDSQGFVLTARRLAAAVVTQLFSYMIGKGIQFGYICTGQALVLLHIPNDPSTVYFSVCVPNQDVMDDDETSLRCTAVAQVFAFILQALHARPPPQMWHDAAETLGIWTVEYDDILRDIPPSERKRKEPRASPYRPQHWKGFKRSPIRTRSRCQQPGTSVEQPKEDDEDPPSPTPNPSRTSVEGADLVCLQHEKDIYDHLQPIQGEYVPICLGIIVLAIPYYYDSGIWVHFMFLSWAGQPILDCVDPAMKAGIATAVAMAYRAVHKLRVLHRDAQPRNILYNTTSRGFMVVDFERAEFHCRRPLVSIEPNLNRKRKRRAVQKQKKNDFARELESAVANALSCVVNLPF